MITHQLLQNNIYFIWKQAFSFTIINNISWIGGYWPKSEQQISRHLQVLDKRISIIIETVNKHSAAVQYFVYFDTIPETDEQLLFIETKLPWLGVQLFLRQQDSFELQPRVQNENAAIAAVCQQDASVDVQYHMTRFVECAMTQTSVGEHSNSCTFDTELNNL